MIYRKDLIEHYEWLSDSKYFTEALDEALVAIALCARGHEHDLMNFGGAWVEASYHVERFGLEEFVEKERRDNVSLDPIEPEGPLDQQESADATVSHMEIGVRDLRNRTAQVIDAVKAGERVVLTVNGEPTADIVPHGQRTRWLSGPQLQEQLRTRAADPALADELAEAAGQTLDEL
jgi:prevent-host-death family protein